MKILVSLLLSLTFCVHVSYATNYYFSSVSGDDTRTDVLAQNPSTPWKSIDKLNTLTGLKPGDSVFLKRGEVFFGSIVIRNSGVSGNVIYYGAYGTGANPVVTGFTTLTSWTLSSSGIYYASLNRPWLNIVTVNGEAKGMGRYPNTGFLNYENNNGNLSITDNELPASPNWTGAEIVMRKYRFILDRHAVTAHSGSTLTYNTSTVNGNNSRFLPVKGNGYFFQNHLQTLDQFGEWYYDSVAKRLYMFFGSSAPSSFVVKASAVNMNASVEVGNYVTLENLSFEGANQRGLNLAYSSNILVQNCSFFNQGGSAVYGDHVSYVTVKGGSVNTSFSNGVNFEQNADFCTVDGVSVRNSNTIPGSGRSGNGVSIGISVTGDNSKIINNRVVNSGYSGIQFLGNNVLVERNVIDTFCTLKDDGGGVYTFEGSANETNFNRKIKNNIVLNAIGAMAGAEAYYYEAFGKAAGIYLDEHVNNVEVTGNTVANGDWGGIFLHNAHHNTITNNIFYNFRYQVLISQYTAMTRNNTVTSNQFISKLPHQETLYYRTFVADNPSTMGAFDNNYYARPIDDNKTIHGDFFQSGGAGTLYYTLAEWKANFNLDANSKKSPITYKANINDSMRFEYNDGSTPKLVALNASYLDVKGTQYAGHLSLAPLTGVVLLKSPTAFKLNQVITFPAIADKSLGDPAFVLNAVSTSGLPVVYRVVSGPATVSGSTVTLTGLGAVTIEASQAGNTTYKPADVVTQNFTVLPPNSQTITFPAIPSKAFGDPPFALAATASSGLPVSYQLISGQATISGNIVTLTSASIGTVIIEATQAGNTSFKAATPVRQSFAVAKGSQTITFPAIPAKTFGDAPFALTATASSGLPVAYRLLSGPATVAGNMVTIRGAGVVVIEASQLGDGNYNAASATSQQFLVGKAAQTISFPAIPNKLVGDPPFTLGANASSGLPVSYRVLSGPATITGNAVTVTGTGEVWIEASQPGDANYNPASATSQNFQVNTLKQSQTITFPAISTKTFGDAPFTLNATASSGLPVTYSVLSGPATVSGKTVTITGVGEVWIEASQSGNTTYNAAPAVNQSFTVNRANQTITFPALAPKSFGDAPFPLNATASSGLAVSYRVLSGPASLSGNTVTLNGIGEVWIEASQSGNANYYFAPAVSNNFYVSKGNQVITFPVIPNKFFGDPPFALNATVSSGLPVSYRVLSGPATISGNMVTITGLGEVWIEASQAGNANYNPAAALSRNFFVSQLGQNQSITFPSIPNKSYGDAPFTLNATASSGLPVGYRVLSGPATVSGNTVTLTGIGTVIIEASQGGNSTYSAAAPVQQSFGVNMGSQTITFPAIANRTYGEASFALNATASSGLPVTYRVLSGPATLNGNVVTVTGVGEVWIEASQSGNAFYLAAPAVSQNFQVARAPQTITFPAIPNKTFGDPPFTISATASSGLPVTFRVASGPATISGNVVTLTGTGSVWIEASQSGNSNYEFAASISRNFIVTSTGRLDQTITFPPAGPKAFGDAPFTLNATASSGLPVSYRILSGPATVSGSTVTLTGVGTVIIEAAQVGNAAYNAATEVHQALTVSKGNQTITFPAIPNKTLGDPIFALTATASSGLPVLYRVVSGPATITGNTVSISGLGNVTIEASQPGDANYNAATPVQQSFTVVSQAKQNQTITFAALPARTFGDAPFTLNATASSGLPVSFRVVSGPATINGNTVTITAAGLVTIEASQAGNTTYNAAPSVQQSFTVNKASQAITFAVIPGKTFGDAPFTISATATSGLPVSFSLVSGPATLSGNTVTITGAGVITITAAQAGNANYNAATTVSQSVTVAKASQSITFAALPNKTFGDAPFTVNATASSGLPVSFRIVSGPANLSGSMMTITGAGVVVVEASQSGDANFNAATAVQHSITVSKAAQTITFAAIPGKLTTDPPFALNATTTAGLPVSYRVVSGPATIAGNIVTLTGTTGTVTIEASQAGNTNVNAALPVTQSFAVTSPAKQNQVITFTAISSKTYGDAPFIISATASSGLPVNFRIVSGPATISGSTVTINGAGSVSIEATQAGNTTYNAATPVTQAFTVNKASQTITFGTLSNKVFGDAPFTLNATASSGLPVSFSVVSGPATISGNAVTLTGAGMVMIAAVQAGDGNYNAAAAVQQSFSVAKASQTITFPAIANRTYGDAPFTVTATASSGLPVSFSVVSGPATVAGNVVTLTGTGTVVLETSQPGDANYNAALPVQQSFTVASPARQPQTITFPAIANKVFGNAPFTISATASSGLPVSFRVVSGPATVAGNTVTITGAGTVTVEATQPGDATYNAATPVSRSFTVARAAQTITFPTLSYKIYGSQPFTLAATASSGLPVSYRVVSGPISISGNTVTITGTGSATIEASQVGSTNYNAATPVLRSFTIGKASQTITFPAITAKVTSDAPFALNATASSGLAVSYRVVSGPATVAGNIVTLTGATGAVTIAASQAGNSNYNAATAVNQSFSVTTGTKQSQVITFAALPGKVFGDAPFTLNATASSGLPVSFRIVSGPATITGNTVTLTGAGVVGIEATQAGNTTYNAATPVTQTFTVTKASQTITFGTLSNRTFGDAPFTLNATAASGLPVSLRVLSGPATIAGNTVTLTGAGTVVVEATQPGDANYNAAATVQQSFSVGKAAQTITFAALPNKTFGDAPFTLTATASSGLLVSFRLVSGPATISGNTVTLTGTGVVQVEASQVGNTNYSAAVVVNQSFTVTPPVITKQNQVITFPTVTTKTFGNPPFALSATASSGLPVSYRVVSGPATLSGTMVTLTGAGTVTIEASQSGDASYNAAPAVTQSFLVNKALQTISFAALPGRTFGEASFALSATASSGLAVSFRVASGPATLSGNTVTLTGTGTVTIEASQGGDANYTAAPAISQSFTVAKANQTITFGPLAGKLTTDAPFTLTATASSGLAVGYRVVSGPATITGNTVTLTGTAGAVVIEALQAGNGNYNAASPVQRSFTVTASTTTKLSQTITFPTLAYKTYSSPPFNLTATASSGLPVSYRVVSGPISISGNTVTITGTGSATIEASQSGDVSYNPATPVLRSFTIGKGSQTITFTAPPTKTFGDPPFALTATASSGLPVSYRVVSGPATVSGNTVSLTGVGSVTIEATQAGNANYNAAPVVNRSFSVVFPSTGVTVGTGGTKGQENDPRKFIRLTMYPNPVYTQGYLLVEVPADTRGLLAIVDGAGRLVKMVGERQFQKGTPTVVAVNVSDLRNGNYTLVLITIREAVSLSFKVM